MTLTSVRYYLETNLHEAYNFITLKRFFPIFLILVIILVIATKFPHYRHFKFDSLQEPRPRVINVNSSTDGIKKLKRILLWTKFFGVEELQEFCVGGKGLMRQREICEYQCEFTKDRKFINSSDVVVFHGRNLESIRPDKFELDAPSPRNKSQPWIFLMLESPSNSESNFAQFNNTFNWTMTYRRDSDILTTYGKVLERQRQEKLEKIPIGQAKKSKLIAWINSNKNAYWQPSKRQEFAAEIQKYLKVDIYGRDREFKCSKVNDNICEDVIGCYKEIAKDYKFYLALENSLCEDYVTEKAFNALITGMVPIVYGHVDYGRYLPPNSYIDIRNFANVKKLARYLVFLDQHEDEYLKYFRWKRTHVVVEDKFYLERAWCSLCERLSRPRNTSEDMEKETKIVSDLGHWWNFRNGSNVCIPAPENPSLSLKFKAISVPYNNYVRKILGV